MKTQKLNRIELAAIIGEAMAVKLDAEGCDFSGGKNQQDEIEFRATVSLPHMDDFGHAEAVYCQTQANVDAVQELDNLTWTVAHYNVI